MKKERMNSMRRLISDYPMIHHQPPTYTKPVSNYLAIITAMVMITFLIAGCKGITRKPSEEDVMIRLSSFSYPKFTDDLAYDGLENCIIQSLSYLRKIPQDRVFEFGKDRYDTNHMIRSLEYFLEYIQNNPSRRDLKKFIRSNYRVYRSIGRDGNGEVLYTGYYEPHLRGSLKKNAEYQFPIYARPDDLISINLSLFSEKYEGESIIGRYTDQSVVP